MEKQIGNENSPESAQKRSDYLRKELEQFSYIDLSLDKWSTEQKEEFLKWCRRFNNFYTTIGLSLNLEALEKEREDKRTMKEIYGLSDEDLVEEIRLGESSAKYNNGTSYEFYNNVRQALIDNNVDLDGLKDLDSENDELRGLMLRNPKKVMEDSKLMEKYRNNRVAFYKLITPIIFSLIDSGYVERELSR